MRLILIKCSVRSKGKALVMTLVVGVFVCLYLGVNKWMTLYSCCKHWLLTAKLAFVNCVKGTRIFNGKRWLETHSALGNSPFIVPLHLPEGTRDLGLPVSSHTHWLRDG